MWTFIIIDDINDENLDLHGAASSILTISTMDMMSQTKNFYSSNSNYPRCKIFTSRYMFSKQAKTIELVRNRLPVSKIPQNPIWPPFFAKNVCDTLSNNTKLMLINADTNAALNLQEENIVFTPRFSPWLQCICSKMTSIKYLGALATRVIKYESSGNVTPAYITYF